MRAKLQLVVGFCAAAFGGVLVQNAHAAVPLVTLTVEGNPTCNTLAVNQQISEVRFNAPINGTIGTTQKIAADFATDPSRIVTWSVAQGVPVNIVIVKGQGGASGAVVYHYGIPGATNGEGQELLPPSGANIATAAFCYGLGGTAASTDGGAGMQRTWTGDTGARLYGGITTVRGVQSQYAPNGSIHGADMPLQPQRAEGV